MLLRDREHQRSDALRRQRVGGNAARLGIDRLAGFQRARERRGRLRLDAGDRNAAFVPRRDSTDEASAADGHEHGVGVGRLLLQFRADGGRAEEGLALVERMNAHRARAGGPGLAGGARVVVAVAGDDELRAVGADARDLGGGGDRRNEDLRAHAETHGRVRGGHAVIAAGRGDDAGVGHVAEEHVREGAAGLEGPGVLEVLELEEERAAVEAEVAAADFDDGSAADVGSHDGAGLIHLRP